ncbi:porin [Shewanella mesophila]|uniref:porin n=1 Tax=Shewanella mesophila TaxID=2864208 RepID=UPI001C65A4F3|nr:porin [Shewanella mesophila]QYJ86020.1 porin [Shewanella mesophila]
MNIKLVITSLTLLVAAGVSTSVFADSQKVYGRVWLALNNSDNGLISNRKDSGTGIESYSSYIGVKGDTVIDDDFKVIYKVEITNTGGFYESSNLFSAKNNYLGVENKYGSLTIGRNDSVFKSTEGKVDLFNITSSDMSKMLPGNDRLYEVATLYTKSINGFKFGVTYQLDSKYDGNDVGYAVHYGDSKLRSSDHYVAIGYADGLNGLKAQRVTYSTKALNCRLGLIYQHSKSTQYDSLKGNSYLISLAYPLSKGEILAQYGKDESGLGTIASQIASKKAIQEYDGYLATIGYTHFLNKSTAVNGYFSHTDNDTKYDGEDHSMSDNAVNLSLKYQF